MKRPKPVALTKCPSCGCENNSTEDGNDRCFHCDECEYLQCTDWAYHTKRDLEFIVSVSHVIVERRERALHVEIFMREFTRNARRRVYAVERSLIEMFPFAEYEFSVIDASEPVESDPTSRTSPQTTTKTTTVREAHG